MSQPQPNGQQNGAAVAAAPLSCADIAKILQRHVVSVFRCIEREGIEAELTTPGGFKFYNPSVVPQIRAAMRRPNGSNGK